jgi:glycosyltransferase involved in cell wall biosynthesis
MRIVALIERLGHVCARYRLAAFAPALKEAGCGLTFKAIPRSPMLRLMLFAKLKPFDAVILQRMLLPSYQLNSLRRNSRRLIFDFDDAVFGNDSYDPRGIASTLRERRFAGVVAAADQIIAGNHFLKESAIAGGARADSVYVMPTCIDPSKYPLAKHHSGDSLNLVWIGSAATLTGLERRRDLVEKLADRFPHLRLRIICDRFPDFAHPPIDAIPWAEATEAAEIAQSDIGMTWLPDDPWSRGKCGLKVLQYYGAGLPVIANSIGVHPEMIDDGVTGILADTDQQWIDAICLLRDPAQRQPMGRAARKFVEERYSIDTHRNRFVDLLTSRRRPR